MADIHYYTYIYALSESLVHIMICFSEECLDDLDDPEHGCVVTTGNLPGDKAVYFCDYGFTLKGEKKRKCEAGKWSGTYRTCESKFQIYYLLCTSTGIGALAM